jgi:hypothetical protein
VLWKSDEIERSDDEEEDSDGSNPPELVEYDEDDEEEGSDDSDGEEEDEEEGSDQDGWEDCSEGSGEGESESNANGADGEGEGEGDQDEWESCSDDDEEEEEEDDSEAPELVAVSTEPRVRLDQRRILTAEDFSLLDKLKSAQRERLSDPRNRSKRKRLGDDDDDEEEGSRPSQSYAVSEDQIAPEAKVKKATKIERLTRVLEGRVENRFVHDGHAGGLTNKEKQRKKNYVMVRKGKREVATKNRRSNSEVRWQKSKAVSSISSLSLPLSPGWSADCLCRKSSTEETEESAEELKEPRLLSLLRLLPLDLVAEESPDDRPLVILTTRPDTPLSVPGRSCVDPSNKTNRRENQKWTKRR